LKFFEGLSLGYCSWSDLDTEIVCYVFCRYVTQHYATSSQTEVLLCWPSTWIILSTVRVCAETVVQKSVDLYSRKFIYAGYLGNSVSWPRFALCECLLPVVSVVGDVVQFTSSYNLCINRCCYGGAPGLASCPFLHLFCESTFSSGWPSCHPNDSVRTLRPQPVKITHGPHPFLNRCRTPEELLPYTSCLTPVPYVYHHIMTHTLTSTSVETDLYPHMPILRPHAARYSTNGASLR